jgi:hypothetical protein
MDTADCGCKADDEFIYHTKECRDRRRKGNAMAIPRLWDLQWAASWWFSLGFHIDHCDPSLTLHLPGLIVCVGRCKQPGFRRSLRRLLSPATEGPDR